MGYARSHIYMVLLKDTFYTFIKGVL